ncbi:MAG TPA: hypothetical protein VGF15_05990, partial [Solirubrobacteraceae bacterium]
MLNKPAIIALTLAVFLGFAAAAEPGVSANGPPFTLTISPLNGTPDAPPASQISFLGAPASELHDILVKGSHSGVHTGKLEAYSTGTGASFVPTHPFQAGERVSVSAVLGSGSSAQTLSSSFTVGALYTLPSEKATSTTSSGSVPIQGFHSRHDLHPPQVKVTTAAATPALGDILISPDSGPTQAGPMIVEPSGG